MRYLEKYYPDNLGIEITKLKNGLQNTIKEHSLLMRDVIEDRSFYVNENNFELNMETKTKTKMKMLSKEEKKMFDLRNWEIIHSGYLVFLSEALQVSR